ncbi:MAG TPA: hypothetical protein ENH85_01195 [Candidatus Scalindua sp.]|nr:hypothetical protein [Candidatus Scalindua sp.]
MKFPTGTRLEVLTPTSGDARYLKLDASNDPITSDLEIDGSIQVDGGTFTVGTTPVGGDPLWSDYSVLEITNNQGNEATALHIKGGQTGGDASIGAIVLFDEDEDAFLNHEVWSDIANIFTYGDSKNPVLSIQGAGSSFGDWDPGLDVYFGLDSIDGQTGVVRGHGFPTGESLSYGQFQVVSGPKFEISTDSGTDVGIKLPDNAGSSKFSITDSDDTEITSIDSDGLLYLHGTAADLKVGGSDFTLSADRGGSGFFTIKDVGGVFNFAVGGATAWGFGGSGRMDMQNNMTWRHGSQWTVDMGGLFGANFALSHLQGTLGRVTNDPLLFKFYGSNTATPASYQIDFMNDDNLNADRTLNLATATGTGATTNTINIGGESDDVISIIGFVGIGTDGPVDKLHVVDTRTDNEGAALFIQHTGSTPAGASYGIVVEKTGASSRTNVGGSFSASGADNNYGLLVPNGRVGIGTTEPTSALQMGDDKLIAVDVNAGLTASGTQTQGQGALTAQVNEISTVASKDDTITLPAAVTGIMIEIINNGANTLLIFPASGDNLGLGTDTAEELEANERVGFVAYDTDNWAKEFSTEIIHAEMFDFDNTDPFTINATNEAHMYHTNGMQAGDLADFTFDAGGGGTSFPVASIQAGSSGQAEITTTGTHGLAVGDIVSLTNMSAGTNTGTFIVRTPVTSTTFEITSGNSTDATGTMDQAATLEADAVAAGQYLMNWCASAAAAGANNVFDFAIHVGATHINSTNIRRKFGGAGDVGAMSGVSIITIASGDKVSFMITNTSGSGDITIRDFTLVLVRL